MNSKSPPHKIVMIFCEIGLETERTRDNMTDTNTFHKLSLLFSAKNKTENIS